MRANWGGKRMNSGRKKKPPVAKVLAHPSAPAGGITPPTTNGPSPIEEFDAPDDLLSDERAVWLKQAPHAFKNRTLTRASAFAFERYCKLAALERREALGSGINGPNHRGLLKEIRGYEVHFMLIPAGKPMAEPQQAPQAAAVDDNDAFFGEVSDRRG